MAIPFASAAPIRLDELLQVPLKIIPLEDLIRERVSKISGEDQLCRSADPSTSGGNSSQCLFDCCTTPSRWKKSGPFSNLSKFKSHALKLTDGTLAVMPVMDLSESASPESEIPRSGSDDVEEIPANDTNPRTEAAHVTERNEARPPIISNYNGERASHVISGRRSGESGRSSSSSLSSSAAAPVVLGKVTENPTRYEDLLTGQEESERNNNNSENSDRNEMNVGVSITPPGDQERINSNKQMEPASADNTLKLTYFNDGRKQSEKAFRTNETVEVTVVNDGDGQASTHDSRYFENQHGLQLSRIRRDVDIDRQGDTDNPPPPQRHANANDENTQDKPREAINLNKSSENAWEQYNMLQISRCQKDSPEKVQNLEERDAKNSSNVQEKTNSQTHKTNKGESETSVETHMKSVLTTYKYLRPGAQMGGNASSSRKTMDYSSPTAGASTTVSDSGKLNATTGKSLVHAEVDRGGGVVRVSSAVRSSPGRPRGSSVSKVLTHPSPPIYHHQQSQQSHHHLQNQARSSEPSASSSAWATERAIARIPTRPYLLKNTTYELPPNQQRSNPPNNQQSHGIFPPGGPTSLQAPSSSLHSNAKRFKPANLPANPPAMARQPKQLQSILPNINRQPTLNHSGGGALNPSGNGNIYNPHNPISYIPHHVANLSSSSSSNRSSIMAYHGNGGNVQSNPQQAAILYGNNRSPSHGLTNIPFRSPQGSSDSTRSVRNVESYPKSFPQSLMIAAAVAANSTESADHSDYYERLREYYEYYQQLEWSKLEYQHQQKSQLYPAWDALSVFNQSEQMARQGRTQHQPQRSPDGGRGHGHNATSMTQHQLALRAMEAAGPHRSSMNAGQVSKGIEPYQIHNPQGSHGRGSKIMVNLSPPQTSPPSASLQTIQAKYVHPPHQLQHLRQLQERQYQHQINQINQQEQQLRYQISHQQSRSHTQSYPPPYPQQRQDQQQSPSNNKVQQGASSTPANYEIQNSPQYRAAYDQLAAAASAIAKRPNVMDYVQNHLRTSLNNLNGTNATAPPSIQQEANRYHRHNPKANHQQSSGPSASASMTPIILSSPPTHRISQATTPPTPPNAVPFMPNIHRQTLEHAIKNNFNSHSTDLTIHRDNHSGGTILHNPRYINITPSPPPLPLSPPPTQNSREWQNPAIEGSSHHANMTKEPLQTASSPTYAHQTHVIRRTQQLSPVSPPSPPRKSPIVAQAPMIISRNSPQHHVANPRINYTNNHNLGHHEGVLKRRINIISNRSPPPPPDFDHHHHHHNESNRSQNSPQLTPSPIPLIVGQEEIVTTSILPSSTPTPISPIDGEEEIIEREEDGEGNINRVSNSSPSDGGNWQYDHVVLLDNYIGEMLAEEVDHSRQSAEGSKKRTKTYMCKRCFETLKTEQEIRNHLFCKMLAGHVRCHVCFQLIKTDSYPEHLQVHGVRPLEED